MNGHIDNQKLSKSLSLHEKDDTQAVRDVRKLVIDICRQNGGGHGGSAIGMAPMAVALWRHAMRYNPANPDVSVSEISGSGTDSVSGLTETVLCCPTGTLRCCSTRCFT